MSVLKLRVLPDPVLRQKARRVNSIDNSIRKLVSDMVDTMHSAAGVGLAAPQVGISLRIAVIEVLEGNILVLLNPEVIRREGVRLLTEACLSVPGYQGEIERAERVKVKAQNLQGKEIRIKGEGLLAQALEHEIDHLNGMLYIDHITIPDRLQKVSAEEREI
jgi:peptide deformylase